MTGTKPPATADVMADLEALCRSLAAGVLADADVVRRVRLRSDEVRAAVGANGPVDVAVGLLRESRDDDE